MPILDFGFWILDFGFWVLGFGFWIARNRAIFARFLAIGNSLRQTKPAYPSGRASPNAG